MNRRLGVLLFGIVVAVLVPAGTASAHAELLDVGLPTVPSSPKRRPRAVLRFSEQVSLTGGSAAVLDDTGAPARQRPSVVDVNVVIPLDGGLGDGTYTISWSVISTDSHRISGASVFHVGAPSAGGPVDVASSGGAGWGGSPRRLIAHRRRLCRRPHQRRRVVVHDARRAPDTRPAVGDGDRPRCDPRRLGVIAAIPMRIVRPGGGIERARRR